MNNAELKLPLLNTIIDRINMGVLVVDMNYSVVLWNRFMSNYSAKDALDVVGKSLFDAFPELPKHWLEPKIRNVFILKNYSFTDWENRPYLFAFRHNHPITGDRDFMRQNCTFIPIKNEVGDVQYVCIALTDMTETSIYESKLKKAVSTLENISARDTLTGAFNRRHLENTVNAEFSRIKRYGGKLSVILLDIDKFKNINDTYGHKTGDEVIKKIADNLSSSIRESDIGGRYGGEEFLVILPETDLEGAALLAERIRATVETDQVATEKGNIAVTISLGVATVEFATENCDELIQNADVALYKSKNTGRNRVTIWREQALEPFEKRDFATKRPKRILHRVKIGYR